MNTDTISAISTSVSVGVTAAVHDFADANSGERKKIVERLKGNAHSLSFFEEEDFKKFDKLFAKPASRANYEIEGAALGAIIGGIIGGSIGGAAGAAVGAAIGQPVGASIGGNIPRKRAHRSAQGPL